MRRSLLTCLLVLLCGPALARAPAHVLAGEGQVLARKWCANCHAIAPGHPPPTGDAAPSLPAVAAWAATTETSLRAFLGTPHANMPDFKLSRAEMDAVVAYILSLRP